MIPSVEPQSRIRQIFFAQKIRWDMGLQILSLMNFTLLSITSSDKICGYLNIENGPEVVVVMVVIGFLTVWFFGFFMDKIAKFQQGFQLESIKRSPWSIYQIKLTESINKKLDELIARKGG